jgi:hypothetical protein
VIIVLARLNIGPGRASQSCLPRPAELRRPSLPTRASRHDIPGDAGIRPKPCLFIDDRVPADHGPSYHTSVLSNPNVVSHMNKFVDLDMVLDDQWARLHSSEVKPIPNLDIRTDTTPGSVNADRVLKMLCDEQNNCTGSRRLGSF